VLRLGVSGGQIQSKLLINAVTGRLYDLNNPIQRAACPLQSIALVFNADNIWANIQLEDDPTRCSYELFNPQMWTPFFTATFNRETCQQQYAMKFDTIQKSIHYTEESFEWYVDRASKIERMVERRFEKWRSLTTHWDYGVCKVLRDFLLSFEAHAQREEVAINMDRPLTALKNAYGSIYGFPLHFNDSGDKKLLEASDDNPIISAVRNTKIHENEDSKAVFALAVYIHPYPNRMGSVWLYVASLMEK
jgi:coiled-coil and C2 domain-containing protein 2A